MVGKCRGCPWSWLANDEAGEPQVEDTNQRGGWWKFSCANQARVFLYVPFYGELERLEAGKRQDITSLKSLEIGGTM